MTDFLSVDESRKNWLGSLYADVAVENYYIANCQYEQSVNRQFEHFDEIQDGYDTAIKHAITTVVFSAMAIEALINDYAATCLGDDVFYETFDKLSVIEKFSLIVQFIFHKSLDKSQSYYSGLKSVYSQRNKLVHPKTKKASEDEQFEHWMYFLYDDKNPDAGKIAFEAKYKNETLARIKDARDSIKTMHFVTQYIDENDSEAMATLRLLLPQIITGDDRVITKAKQKVYPELGIKLQYITLN